MDRRWFVLALALASFARVFAASPDRVPIVGVLITHAQPDDPVLDILHAGLKSLGYEDGRNIRLQFVTALGRSERLAQLAQQFADERVDVIFAPNEMAARAAQKVTREIPIVMLSWTGDPVKLGLIASYSRPGGNITGVHSLQSDLEVKRVELVKEALPRLSRVGVLRDPSFPRDLQDMELATRQLGLELTVMEVGNLQDIEQAFRMAKQKRVAALLAMQSPVFYVNRDAIGALSLKFGIPVVAGYSSQVRAGFLMSYGADVEDVFHRGAYYVDRLLKGAKAAELPMEQVSTVKLSINQKTAHALKLTLSESVMQRANEIVR